jgi:hypothetical protein
MLTYNELCDIIISTLITNAEDLGVESFNIFESALIETAPAINVVVEPRSIKAGERSVIQIAEIGIAAITSATDSSTARRDAMSISCKVVELMSKVGAVKSFDGINMIGEYADKIICIAYFTAPIKIN